MNALELIESFSEFKEFKNIDRETMMNILQDVFRSMLKKKFGNDEHIDVIINPDKGDLEIWINREIVPDGEVEDENLEISLSKAKLIENDFEVGEEVAEEMLCPSCKNHLVFVEGCSICIECGFSGCTSG